MNASNILSKLSPEEFLNEINKLIENGKQDDTRDSKTKEYEKTPSSYTATAATIYTIRGQERILMCMDNGILEKVYFASDSSYQLSMREPFSDDKFNNAIERMAEYAKEKNKYVVVEAKENKLSLKLFPWYTACTYIQTWPWDLEVVSSASAQYEGLYLAQIDDIITDETSKKLIVSVIAKMPGVSTIKNAIRNVASNDRFASLYMYSAMIDARINKSDRVFYKNYYTPGTIFRGDLHRYEYTENSIINAIRDEKFDFVKYNDYIESLDELEFVTIEVMNYIYNNAINYPRLVAKINSKYDYANFNYFKSCVIEAMHSPLYIVISGIPDTNTRMSKLVDQIEMNEKANVTNTKIERHK